MLRTLAFKRPTLPQPRLSTAARLPFRALTSAARPFRVLGLQQIAVGSLNKFGLEKVGQFRSEKENVDEDILKLGKGPLAVEVDLMAPLDENKSPKVHIPPLNHIGLWVDDLHAAVKHLQGKGMRFAGGIRKGAGGHDVAFVHPKGNEQTPLSGEGVLIELVQAPPEVVKAFDAIKS